MKVVINKCYGGFGLSPEARNRYAEIHGESSESIYDIKRDDHALVQVVEELGEEAGDSYANLKVVEIPDGVEYEVCDYDGFEHIAEKHRTWS